jgi:hypothetical protein
MIRSIFFRSFIIALSISWLPFNSIADSKASAFDETFFQEKQQDKKKPEVKEVPQSRKQSKPSEVKPKKG